VTAPTRIWSKVAIAGPTGPVLASHGPFQNVCDWKVVDQGGGDAYLVFEPIDPASIWTPPPTFAVIVQERGFVLRTNTYLPIHLRGEDFWILKGPQNADTLVLTFFRDVVRIPGPVEARAWPRMEDFIR